MHMTIRLDKKQARFGGSPCGPGHNHGCVVAFCRKMGRTAGKAATANALVSVMLVLMMPVIVVVICCAVAARHCRLLWDHSAACSDSGSLGVCGQRRAASVFTWASVAADARMYVCESGVGVASFGSHWLLATRQRTVIAFA